jgi:lipopolysaccharide/colanic/teichoic acid biosynthesis glycosyltransferase
MKIVAAVVIAIAIAELRGWIPVFSRWVIRRAGKHFFDEDQRLLYVDAMLGEVESLDGRPITQIVKAVNFARSARRTQLSLSGQLDEDAPPEWATRLLDLLISSLLLMVVWPAIVLIFLVVASKGIARPRGCPWDAPVIRIRRYYGLGGKEIELYLFRWYSHRPGEKITYFERFLMVTALMCLPLLFNVWKGDLALVGPRPLRHRPHEPLSVRPGLSGFRRQRSLPFQRPRNWRRYLRALLCEVGDLIASPLPRHRSRRLYGDR